MGAARIARTKVIPAISRSSNGELFAIAGRDLERTREAQREFGFTKVFGSYEALLDDPEVDAVYIPLPNNLHREWVEKAAARGKHVLCEKPLSGTAADTEAMIRACREHGVLLMEAFAYLHSEVTLDIAQALRDGVIGKPVFAETTFVVRRWPDENIRMSREMFGGCTYDQGCYGVSALLALLGEFPSRITAMGTLTGRGVDDYSCIYMEFPSGARSSTLSGMCSGQRGDRYFIYGTEGTLEALFPFHAQGEVSYSIVRDGAREQHVVSVTDNYQLEVEQFARCIQDGETPGVPNELSLGVARVLDEATHQIYGVQR